MRRPTVLLAAVTLLAGCGGGGGDKSKDTTVKTETKPTAPAPVKPGAPAKALAGNDGTIDGQPARVDVIGLTRSGGVSQLTLRVSNTSTQPSSGAGMQIGQTFDDGVNGTPEKPNEADTLDGVALIDAVNRKKYLVARDSAGACVCDTDLNNAFAKTDQSLTLSATFGAPPANVRTVNVFVPRFGTLRNVPIS